MPDSNQHTEGDELDSELNISTSQQRPNERQKAEAEEEIIQHQRIVDYDTKEYPVEVIVDKYLTGKEEDDNEIFVPDYQREFVWPNNTRSKFIESVLIGLPIPYIFVADVGKGEGRLEIVDGSQRIRTLASFLKDEFQLEGLKKLKKLNEFRFSDLPIGRQRRFKRRTIRLIELTERADEDVRRDIFERINTGSQLLNDMEVRWGTNEGPLLQFIRECASNPLFKELAPLSDSMELRRERDEFILRFFAYLDNYLNFNKRVVEFLDNYLSTHQPSFDDNKAEQMRTEFKCMLKFVEQYFPNGFRKKSSHTRTPRIRFEAISVGVALALRENPSLVPVNLDWLESPEFKEHTTSDASNSRPKVIARIEFVRDRLLGR
jgi:uncharacterized protein with ParB-like and HNH nuclease domain